MKTLLFHVNSFLTGGIEKILLEILHGLDPNQYRIHLSIAYNMEEQEILKAQIPPYVTIHYLLDHPLLTTPHKKKKTGKISVLEKAMAELILPPIQKNIKRIQLKKLLKETDVVIDFDTTLSSLHKLFQDKKTIAYCHFGFNNIWKGQKRKRDKLANRLSHYHHIVMLCDEMKKDAAEMYPVLSRQLVRIYNAVDMQKIQQLAGEKSSLPAYHQQNGYIVSVGRIHEAQKDFTTLIKAYADAVKRYRIKEGLIIVGKGGDIPMLKALATALGIRESVYFTGLQTNPYKWIKQAKLFVFSSKYEGLPTVLIEAQCLHIPIVATQTPTGVAEILLYGKAGSLVPIGDTTAMSDAIFELLDNRLLQERYKENLSLLLPQFDINYMIPQLEKLF